MKEVLTTSVTIPFEYTYTIIIPHKNIPLLLQRCLDSVPLRNDVQIIVVDDGSSSNQRNRLPCGKEDISLCNLLYNLA